MSKTNPPSPVTNCCPVFEVKRWDKKTHHWQNKLFVQDEVIQLFHIPLNFGQVVKRMFAQVTAAKAAPANEDFLLLAYDPSPWKSQLFMTVTKPISTATMTKISGTFYSQVFDGPYEAVPKWIKIMDQVLADKNQVAKKYYFHYAYCPKCAKAYGHNYVIAFAQIN